MSSLRKDKLRKLVVLAVRLVAMEKFATKLGTMAFIWATVVLLGGFVSNLDSKDFRIISMLLLTEGARVFFKSHELDLQEKNLNLKDFLTSIYKRVCLAGSWVRGGGQLEAQFNHMAQSFVINIDTEIIPFISTRDVDFLLYTLQLSSAALSFGFAVDRLSRRYVSDQQNYVDAVKVFYVLIVIETSIFMVVKACWGFYVPRVLGSCKSGFREKLHTQLQGTMLKKFVEAIYTSSMTGMHSDKDFVNYVAEKVAGLNYYEQQESLLLLRALCSSEARARIASRDFIICLFSLMNLKYPQETRQEAISLVADLAQDKEALSTIRLIVSDEERVAVVVKALYPVVSRDVLVLLEKLVEGSVEEGGTARNMFHVKLEVSKHGFEFLMNVMRSKDTYDTPRLAKQALLSLYWNWLFQDVTIFNDIQELFNSFLNEGLLRAGEVLCGISEFAWHKEMLQKLLRDGDGERLQKLLEFVLDKCKGYYSMRILKNVCAGGNHYLGRSQLRPVVDKIWQEKLVAIVRMLPDVQDKQYLFMAMTLFTTVVHKDSLELPASSFTPETKQRLIQKLLSTCEQILKDIGPHTINQVMKSGAEAAKQEPITLEDGIQAVESPVRNELFLFALVCFCNKMLEIDAASFEALAADDKLGEYLRFLPSISLPDEEEFRVYIPPTHLC